MRTGFLLLLLLMVPAVAHAQGRTDVDWNGWGRPLVPLGWTEDGESFVFTKQVEYYPLETIDDESVVPLKLVFGVVHEARTGRQQPYVLELSDEHGRAVRREELAHHPGPSQWRTWLATHPLLLPRGRSSRDAVAQVTGTVVGAAGTLVPWQRGRFHFALPSGQTVRLALQIVVAGKVWTQLATGEGDGGFVGEAEPFWSPDGRRVAWWLVQPTEDDGPHGPTQYIVIGAVGPRVEMIIGPDAESLAWNALDHLEAAGVAPVYVQRAPAHVEHGVVRFAAASEDAARALATRLPGTPQVEPMREPSLFDLSVVAGPELLVPLGAHKAHRSERLTGIGPASGQHLLVGALAAVGAVLAAWLWMRLLARRLRG